jgi:hypothetical protein
VEINESVIIIFSYELKAFNISNYQQKPPIWTLIYDNIKKKKREDQQSSLEGSTLYYFINLKKHYHLQFYVSGPVMIQTIIMETPRNNTQMEG